MEKREGRNKGRGRVEKKIDGKWSRGGEREREREGRGQ